MNRTSVLGRPVTFGPSGYTFVLKVYTRYVTSDKEVSFIDYKTNYRHLSVFFVRRLSIQVLEIGR